MKHLNVLKTELANETIYNILNTSDNLCDLVPFVEFKKRGKHRWSVKFTKSNTSPWVFFTFFKLCKLC